MKKTEKEDKIIKDQLLESAQAHDMVDKATKEVYNIIHYGKKDITIN